MARGISLAVVVTGLSSLFACGSAHTTEGGTGDDGTDAADAGSGGQDASGGRTSDGGVDASTGGDASGGDGGTSAKNDGLFGSWIFETSNQMNATGLQLNEDGTYVFVILELASSSSGQSQDETGTFTAAGGVITWTPTESSCPSPQAVYTTDYDLDGDDLTVTFGSAIVTFVPESASSGGSGSGSSVETGCFSADGKTFTPAPLGPVTNR